MEVVEFIGKALAAGKTKPEIQAALTCAGWSEKEVAKHLAKFADVDFPIPVPARRPTSGPKEAFLYIVMFFAGYAAVIALMFLLFNLLDLNAEREVQDYGGWGSSHDLIYPLSYLLVAGTVYVWMSWRNRVTLRQQPELLLSPIRRWVTYITLAVLAVTLIVWTVTLLAGFLSGAATFLFISKTLVTLLISAGIFLYYRWEISDRSEAK